jgi:RNA polymerase sigma-70 factor (ECF subfamily)
MSEKGMATGKQAIDYGALGDLDLAQRCVARDADAIRFVIAANNQRLFRAAWSVLKNRSEAEEAVQAGYLSAFGSIAGFEGRSALSTWLTRIVINEALGRRRADERRRLQLEQEGVAVLDKYRDALMRGSVAEGPDVAVARDQIRKLIEQAVAQLPESFRSVFVLREIEGLSSEETADILDIPVATVKTRLHRSRRRLQELLAPELRTMLSGTFPFAGSDCAAMADKVIAELGLS